MISITVLVRGDYQKKNCLQNPNMQVHRIFFPDVFRDKPDFRTSCTARELAVAVGLRTHPFYVIVPLAK